MQYVEDLPSVLEVDDTAFVVSSFSKYFGMTGWRLGWIVVPEDFVETATILTQNLFISAPSIAQYAALAAFTDEAEAIFEERRKAFADRKYHSDGTLVARSNSAAILENTGEVIKQVMGLIHHQDVVSIEGKSRRITLEKTSCP